jgi:hypothetical protein
MGGGTPVGRAGTAPIFSPFFFTFSKSFFVEINTNSNCCINNSKNIYEAGNSVIIISPSQV